MDLVLIQESQTREWNNRSNCNQQKRRASQISADVDSERDKKAPRASGSVKTNTKVNSGNQLPKDNIDKSNGKSNSNPVVLTNRSSVGRHRPLSRNNKNI